MKMLSIRISEEADSTDKSEVGVIMEQKILSD